jgi:hypothetical protein
MLTEGLLHHRTQPPTRQQLAKWCINSLKELDEQIVKNAWLHRDYSFFPADVAARSGGADPYDAHDERLLAEDEDTDEEEEMPMDEDDDEDDE